MKSTTQIISVILTVSLFSSAYATHGPSGNHDGDTDDGNQITTSGGTGALSGQIITSGGGGVFSGIIATDGGGGEGSGQISTRGASGDFSGIIATFGGSGERSGSITTGSGIGERSGEISTRVLSGAHATSGRIMTNGEMRAGSFTTETGICGSADNDQCGDFIGDGTTGSLVQRMNPGGTPMVDADGNPVFERERRTHIRANSIGSADIASNAVGSDEIDDDSVSMADLSLAVRNGISGAQAAADAAQADADVVDSTEIVDGTITTADISAAAITALQTDATARTAAQTALEAAQAAQADADVVDSAEIVDGTITTGDISAAAITALQTDATARTAAQTALEAAQAAQADADVVDSAEILDGTIAIGDISAAAITALQTDATARTAAQTALEAAQAAQADAYAVDSAEIVDGTITAADLKDGSVTAKKLSADAVIGVLVDSNGRGRITGDQIANGAIIVRGSAGQSAAQSAGARSAQTGEAREVQIAPGSIGFSDFGDEVNNAFRRIEGNIDRLDEGIAMSMALTGIDIPARSDFAVSVSGGFYQNKQAAAIGVGFRPTDTLLLSLGAAYGLDSEEIGGRVSISFGF